MSLALNVLCMYTIKSNTCQGQIRGGSTVFSMEKHAGFLDAGCVVTAERLRVSTAAGVAEPVCGRGVDKVGWVQPIELC